MKKYIRLALLILVIITALFCYKKIQLLSKPNIILITLDAARKDHFSCYGYSKNTTPFIDSIAKKGIVFENNFSQGTETTASVSSIFYSRYFTKRVLGETHAYDIIKEDPQSLLEGFDSEQIFIPKALSLHNYKTMLFSNHWYFKPKDYFAKQFDECFYNDNANEDIKDAKNIETNKLISKMVSLINNRHNRFFIYWHILYPHAPYPPKVENKEFFSGLDRETIELTRRKYDERLNDSAVMFDEKELECFKGLYDSNLKYADSLVGLLYKELEKNKLLKNTVIIITADHGENLGEHKLLTHGGLPWDSVIKTPLILFYPKMPNEGIRVDGFTQSIDIMPTILDICGIKLPKNKSSDGSSLIRQIKEPHVSRIAVFAENYIRTKKYKYITDKDLLYDIENDPGELNNIAQARSDIKKELKAMFEQYMRPYRDRYEKTVNNKTPDYPFYFIAASLNLEPKDAMETCVVNYSKINEFLDTNKETLNKSWLLDKETWFGSEAIYYVPDKAYKSPINISTLIPDGSYKIYLLVESREEINYPPDQFGLSFRFNKDLPFQYPKDIKLFRISDIHFPYNYYFFLEKTMVKDKKFSVEINLRPKDEKIYLIKLIKFVPEGVKDSVDEEDMSIKNKKFNKNLETLKSLGYL